MAAIREWNFFRMIITIVIKLPRVKKNPRDIRGEMSKRARENDTRRKGWVAGRQTMAPEGCRRLVEYPGMKGYEWSSSVEALARRSAIIGAVACARRRTIDSSECKLLTQRSLLSISFLPFFVRISCLERIIFFLPFRYDDYGIMGLRGGNPSRWKLQWSNKSRYIKRFLMISDDATNV